MKGREHVTVNGENWNTTTFDWKKPEGENVILTAPAAERNKEEIAAVFGERAFAQSTISRVLEIGSGTGQHVEFWAEKFPHIEFVPTEISDAGRASIRGRITQSKLTDKVRDPIALNVLDPPLQIPSADVVVAVNVFHVAPVELIDALARVCQQSGAKKCLFYGAFNRNGNFTAESNQRFDEMLKKQSGGNWGVRDLESELMPAFARHGFPECNVFPVASNNFIVEFVAH